MSLRLGDKIIAGVIPDTSAFATKTELNNKADTTLSNINASTSAKEMIVGWGMPDYSAGVSKAGGTTYTAEVEGFILWNYGGGTFANRLTINGGIVLNLTTQGNYSHGVVAMFPLNKGDTYRLDGYANIYAFYPCKGV